MNNKVNVECPYCKYVMTVSLADLRPGMWYECLKCDQKIRFTEQDIEHLLTAVSHEE